MKQYFNEKIDLARVIIVLIALESILSISIACFILGKVISQHDEELIKVIAADVYDDIRNELLKTVAIAQSMANDVFLQKNLQTENTRTEDEQTELMTEYLSTMRHKLNCGSAFLVAENSKNYWRASGLIKKLDLENDPHDVWYSDFIKANVDYMLNVDTDEADNLSLEVFANARIKDSAGNLLGICGVGADMEVLQKILENGERNYNIKINLVDKNGVVQVDTESGQIETANLSDLIFTEMTGQTTLNKKGSKYIVTKYIPAFDWYLVIQRDSEKMQSAFSNVVIYMLAGSLVALAILLIFIKLSLQKGRQEIEESAKKRGIASHAGLYVSMHLIDLKNNTIHELSKAPDVNLFFVEDGGNAEEKFQKAVKEMTESESLPAVNEFTNLRNLSERMKDKHAIHQEFLSTQYGWCKAYFMIVDNNFDGTINQIVFAIELIDEAKRREKHLLYLSETDAMTGIRNRGGGEKAIAELMAVGVEGMFCLMDADKFKSINDNYGHDVGDKVIKAIADCLQKAFRNTDITMRLGGDEFAAYATGVTDEEYGEIIIMRLFNLIDKIDIPELGERKITISLGAAFFKLEEDLTFAELYKRADSVAYESKKTEGNFATFYKNDN